MEGHDQSLDLVREEIDDIIGKTPSWFFRSGLTLLLVFFIFILLMSAFIKFPEVIEADISIYSKLNKIMLVTQKSGYVKLRVNNRDFVEQNEIVGYIESSVSFSSYLLLKKTTLHIDSCLRCGKMIDIPEIKNLGEFQSIYDEIKMNIEDFYFYMNNNKQLNNIKELNYEKECFERYMSIIKEQYSSQKEMFELEKERYFTDSVLFTKDMGTFDVLNESKTKFMKAKLSYSDYLASLISNEIQKNTLEYDILLNQIELKEKTNELKRNVEIKLYELITSIGNWEIQNLIRSPIQGIVNYYEIYSDGQYCDANCDILEILPDSQYGYKGRAFVSLDGAGKIKPGQDVYISIDDYPQAEYGVLCGKVVSKSLTPIKKGLDVYYFVDIQIDGDFVTNYGKQITLTQNMEGKAKINTDDVNLLERLIKPVKEIFNSY